jgi:hypothetical protein
MYGLAPRGDVALQVANLEYKAELSTSTPEEAFDAAVKSGQSFDPSRLLQLLKEVELHLESGKMPDIPEIRNNEPRAQYIERMDAWRRRCIKIKSKNRKKRNGGYSRRPKRS